MNNTTNIGITKTGLGAKSIATTAMLSAISFILAFVKIHVPFSPEFAMFDLSDFPALIGSFAFGPLCGVLIELVKNALQLFFTTTAGVGELANFIMGGSYVFSAGLIYGFRKTRKTAWIACIASSFIMGIAAAAANYFILLPAFEKFLPLEELIAAFGAIIPFIKTKFDIVVYNAFPFNLLKGLAIGAVTMPVYKKLETFMKGVK